MTLNQTATIEVDMLLRLASNRCVYEASAVYRGRGAPDKAGIAIASVIDGQRSHIQLAGHLFELECCSTASGLKTGDPPMA